MTTTTFDFWGRKLNVNELSFCIRSWADQLDIKGERVLLRSSSPFDRLVSLLAVLHEGGVPILDEARILNPLEYSVVINNEFGDNVSKLTDADTDECISRILNESGHIVFATSGSTGTPSQISKSVGGLLLEVKELRAIYQLKPNSVIASLVGPLHVYGFLHGFLLPLINGFSAFFVDTGIFEIPETVPNKIDLLVVVPALWGISKTLIETRSIKVMVTSAGVFGPDRALELSNIAKGPEISYEIFGSTETGGVGYRLLEPYDDSFFLFLNVKLCPVPQGTRVESPFLGLSKSVVIADKLEPCADNRFRFNGRMDRVIKYSGQRVSLDVLEEQIESVTGQVVKCLFFEDLTRPQGGQLIAVMAGNTKQIREGIIRECRKKIRGPVPNRFFHLKEFPLNENGKVTSAGLVDAIGQLPSESPAGDSR